MCFRFSWVQWTWFHPARREIQVRFASCRTHSAAVRLARGPCTTWRGRCSPFWVCCTRLADNLTSWCPCQCLCSSPWWVWIKFPAPSCDRSTYASVSRVATFQTHSSSLACLFHAWIQRDFFATLGNFDFFSKSLYTLFKCLMDALRWSSSCFIILSNAFFWFTFFCCTSSNFKVLPELSTLLSCCFNFSWDSFELLISSYSFVI